MNGKRIDDLRFCGDDGRFDVRCVMMMWDDVSMKYDAT
jgi:hypothetical protein